jgi:hypothetical protein
LKRSNIRIIENQYIVNLAVNLTPFRQFFVIKKTVEKFQVKFAKRPLLKIPNKHNFQLEIFFLFEDKSSLSN